MPGAVVHDVLAALDVIIVAVIVDRLVEVAVYLVEVAWFVNVSYPSLRHIGNIVYALFVLLVARFVVVTANLRSAYSAWILAHTHVLVICIQSLPTSNSDSGLFLFLLLFLLGIGLDVFLLLGEFHKGFPLLFNVVFILPVVPVARALLAALSFSIGVVKVSALTPGLGSKAICLRLELRIDNDLFFFPSKLSSKFGLFNLDS